MNLKYVILGTALFLPMTLLSCDDSKVPSEPVDDVSADGLDAPNFTSVGFGSKWHDPHIKGAEILTFDGTTDTESGEAGDCAPATPCQYGGNAKRFKSKDGAEVNTLNSDARDGAYAGIYPKKNNIKGKLLGRVKELDFSYAGGGPIGGSPRFSIPIDDDLPVPEPDITATANDPIDGHTDGYAFADVTDGSGCNDGDGFVGVNNGEDDDTCNWYYKDPVTPYPNWAAFAAAHPTWRIATDATPFVIVDQPGHYLLFMLDIR